jgi:hypothetical protein
MIRHGAVVVVMRDVSRLGVTGHYRHGEGRQHRRRCQRKHQPQ